MTGRDVGVVLAAAGSGSRFGKPKQFELISGEPIYRHVVRTFSQIASVKAVVVVTRTEDVAEIERGLSAMKLPCETQVIAGGETRQDSVANGLNLLRSDPSISIVLVHDV